MFVTAVDVANVLVFVAPADIADVDDGDCLGSAYVDCGSYIFLRLVRSIILILIVA
eukprot:m.35658 g.35658  ORF g.35658 m.35658 type:complete len:56 (+) comp11172_c1_seq1:210-377(+)